MKNCSLQTWNLVLSSLNFWKWVMASRAFLWPPGTRQTAPKISNTVIIKRKIMSLDAQNNLLWSHLLKILQQTWLRLSEIKMIREFYWIKCQKLCGFGQRCFILILFMIPMSKVMAGSKRAQLLPSSLPTL